MQKKNKKYLYMSIGFIMSFVIWTMLIQIIDVKAIGPWGSEVGLATINGYIHKLIGVNMKLYVITDWLGLVPIGVAFGFAILGLVQWIKRKNILKVDYNLFVLGGFYLATIAVYILFEYVVINYRPVLIQGYLEASYPSSTTTLVTCVMPTAIMQFNDRIKNTVIRRIVSTIIIAFIGFMVIGRILSGVHWFSDIVGGVLVSIGLVTLYAYAVENAI